MKINWDSSNCIELIMLSGVLGKRVSSGRGEDDGELVLLACHKAGRAESSGRKGGCMEV